MDEESAGPMPCCVLVCVRSLCSGSKVRNSEVSEGNNGDVWVRLWALGVAGHCNCGHDLTSGTPYSRWC